MSDDDERAKILGQVQMIRADLGRMNAIEDGRRARTAAEAAFDASLEWLQGLRARISAGQPVLTDQEWMGAPFQLVCFFYANELRPAIERKFGPSGWNETDPRAGAGG